MTKINKEEYKFLKSLDDKWKWIARDDNYGGSIFCFRKKPNKDIRRGEWGPDTTQYKWLGKCEILFQFIKWEDREPYNIAELIEEYEHKEFYDYVGWKYAEREEPEVNKDIQWLKREIHKELESWHGVEGGIDGDGINEIMLLINQLDEPEVLSREWISENVEYAYFDILDGSGRLSSATAIIKPEKLQNLLVPKQELPVIPKFVAEWIKETKPYNSLRVAFEYIAQRKRDNHDDELALWVEEGNSEAFARAWLDGYTIEQEPKYYAKVKGWGVNGNDGHAYYSGKFPLSLTMSTESVAHTKDEWKNYGVYEDNADFVKVEELEE